MNQLYPTGFGAGSHRFSQVLYDFQPLGPDRQDNAVIERVAIDRCIPYETYARILAKLLKAHP